MAKTKTLGKKSKAAKNTQFWGNIQADTPGIPLNQGWPGGSLPPKPMPGGHDLIQNVGIGAQNQGSLSQVDPNLLAQLAAGRANTLAQTPGTDGRASVLDSYREDPSVTPRVDGIPPDYNAMAKADVSATLDPKLKAIQRAIDALVSGTGTGIGAVKKNRDDALSHLLTMYSNLDTYLKQNAKQGKAQNHDTAADVKNNYADLSKELKNTGKTAAATVGNELSRLGLGADAADTSGLTADNSFAQQMAKANAGQAAAGFQREQSQDDALARSLQGDSMASGSAQRGQVVKDANSAIDQLIQQRNTGVASLQGQMSDAESQRAYLIQKALQGYQAQQGAQQQQDFTNSLSVDKFNQVQQMNDAKLAQMSKVMGGGGNLQPNQGYASGIIGAGNFVSQAVADPKLQGALNYVLGLVNSNTNVGKYNQTKYSDMPAALDAAMESMQKHYPSYNNATTRSLLADALKVYWGKY